LVTSSKIGYGLLLLAGTRYQGEDNGNEEAQGRTSVIFHTIFNFFTFQCMELFRQAKRAEDKFTWIMPWREIVYFNELFRQAKRAEDKFTWIMPWREIV